MTTNVSTTTVKCLVWDLDGTLWQGVLLEDADVTVADGVRETVRELDARGILQSVASKNDHEHAWAKLEALGLAEYFVLPQIGWGPKSESVRRIADRLDFALGTVAFVDDTPSELAEVSYHLPEVRCYPAHRVQELAGEREFTPPRITADSRRRREMYQAGFEREAARTDHQGPDEDFLRTLDLVMEIHRAGEESISRVEELTLRTSQMNATGVHYSDADLRALLSDPGHEVLVVSLTDRFGPHGAVGVLLLEKLPGVWRLKLLATSCRVVAFGAGNVILRWLMDQAARAGVHLTADFKPTDRNRIMEIAYRFAGFGSLDCADCARALSAPGADPSGADPSEADPSATDPSEARVLHLLPEEQPAPGTMRLTAPSIPAASDQRTESPA